MLISRNQAHSRRACGVALLQPHEPGLGHVVQPGIGLLRRVEPHVELEQPVERRAQLFGDLLGPGEVLLQFGIVLFGPGLVGRQHGAELGAPVAQVVEPHHRAAQVAVHLGQRVADHGRAQVPDGEQLGDVGRAVLHQHGLPVRRGAAERHRPEDGLQQQPGPHLRPQLQVEVGPGRHQLGPLDGELAGQILGQLLRVQAQGLGRPETGKGVIAEVPGARPVQGDLLSGQGLRQSLLE